MRPYSCSAYPLSPMCPYVCCVQSAQNAMVYNKQDQLPPICPNFRRACLPPPMRPYSCCADQLPPMWPYFCTLSPLCPYFCPAYPLPPMCPYLCCAYLCSSRVLSTQSCYLWVHTFGVHAYCHLCVHTSVVRTNCRPCVHSFVRRHPCVHNFALIPIATHVPMLSYVDSYPPTCSLYIPIVIYASIRLLRMSVQTACKGKNGPLSCT